MRTRAVLASLALAACARNQPPGHTPSGPAAQRAPIALTYLGVAGWQLDAAGKTLLADPYLSRPNLDAPLVPDAQAIAAHTPARADLVMVGHSHADHLLDAPSVALRTGAQLMGSLSSTRVARASGVAEDRLITVAGGEDYEMEGYSVRVIPSLHSALGAKHTIGGVNAGVIEAAPQLPMRMAQYLEGGTLAYLVRIAGQEVMIFNTANFIEREVAGLRPDIAIIAPGLREHIHDYTCRLLHALGDPPIVIATHFDDWKGAPVDDPGSAEMAQFGEEVRRCSPRTRFVVPRHFEKMTFEPAR